MKRLIILCLVMTLLVSCGRYPAKEKIRQISERIAPESMHLEGTVNSYVQRAILDDGTEIGSIRMRDGSSSHYWFRSHHLTGDIGGTWFAMSDGTKSYMAGWFCCEVQLPGEQLASLNDLKKFIRKHHGIAP